MQKVNVLNQQGEKIEELALLETVFGIEPNHQVLFEVVNAQRAAMRQGTHNTKTRTEVRGGGKKPWRQKGTGRARHGSIRSPIWRGGGVTFGPKPRSYDVKLNRKVKKLAIKSALSQHLKNNTLVILDNLVFEQPKTKLFAEMLNNLPVIGKTLFVVNEHNENAVLSASNLQAVLLEKADHVSVYDLLNCKTLVLTKDAVKYFEEALS